MVGGLNGFGDVGIISSLTGLPTSTFLIAGLILFATLYPVFSKLFIEDSSKIFPNVDYRILLSSFWLTLPLYASLYVFFSGLNFSPQASIIIPLSSIPSILSIFLTEILIKKC